MANRHLAISINGRQYNLVNDHDTYVVSDIPSHPDADPRMERRVTYDSFSKGIQKRREARAVDTQVTSVNVYNRVTRAGEGIWWANGGDTRMADRIFAQRNTYPSTPSPLASAPRYFGDISASPYYGGAYSFAICDQHVYIAEGGAITPQSLTLSQDFNVLYPNLGTNRIYDYSVFFGKLYVSICGFANNVYTPGTSQGTYSTWDATSPTGNWAQVTGPFTVVAGTPVVTCPVNEGQRFDYYIIATNGSADSIPSATGTTSVAAKFLYTNNVTVTFNRVAGATQYKIFRSYSSNSYYKTGYLGTINDPGSGVTTYFTDLGNQPSLNYYSPTPGFAAGDTGKGTCFAVIRGNLWRSSLSSMWVWDGIQPNWSAEYIVGDRTSGITALDVYQDALIIFKQDGIYSMDRQQNIFPLFPGFKTLGYNPRPLGQWRGSYYFASDPGMIWEWDGNTVNRIGFDFAEGFPFPSGIGIPNAVTRGMSLPNMFVVGFNKWTYSQLPLKGSLGGYTLYGGRARNSSTGTNEGYYLAYDGEGWHPFHFESAHQVSGVGVTANGSPTVQFGITTTNGDHQVRFLPSPIIDPFLAADFDASPQDIYLNVDNGIIPDEWKIAEFWRVYVEQPTAGTVRLAYAIDGDINLLNFTDLGIPNNDQTTMQTFAAQIEELPAYRKLLLRIRITPNTNAATPVVRSITQRYKQRQPQRKSWELILLLEEGQLQSNRTRMNKTSAQMLNDLNAARKQRTLVPFIDVVGDTYQVYVESVGEAIKSYRNSVGNAAFIAKVQLVEPAELPYG